MSKKKPPPTVALQSVFVRDHQRRLRLVIDLQEEEARRASLATTFAEQQFHLYRQTPDFAPRHVGNLWTTYQWKNGFGGGVGGRYLSSVFSRNENGIRLGGSATWDATAFYRRLLSCRSSFFCAGEAVV
ncbi:MAG TPA: TonB-dependent receptor [Blastocatellia bacterium]|nr:TonB-dependent receptor [Blastocatellia bacterium]